MGENFWEISGGILGKFFSISDPRPRLHNTRAAPILLANFFEKQEAKSKEQNSRKIGEKLGKWVSENCNLAYLHCKDGDTLLEQSQTGLNQHNIMLLENRKIEMF